MEGFLAFFYTVQTECFKKIQDGELVEPARASVPTPTLESGRAHRTLPAQWSQARYAPVAIPK